METDEQLAEVSRLEMLIADEEQKRATYRVENVRRRHNYLPFIVELLRVLAEQGKLVGRLTERALGQGRREEEERQGGERRRKKGVGKRRGS